MDEEYEELKEEYKEILIHYNLSFDEVYQVCQELDVKIDMAIDAIKDYMTRDLTKEETKGRTLKDAIWDIFGSLIVEDIGLSKSIMMLDKLNINREVKLFK